MIIGILETDKVDEKPRQQYGGYAQMFIKLLSVASNKNKAEFKVYQTIDNHFPQDINECDAYLITGSKFSAYDKEPWIINLIAFIQQLDQAGKKCIGICFGHQVIAQALGGKVEKSEKGWGIGLMSADIKQNKIWMQPAQKKIKLLVSHQDQVIMLPKSAELIASNNFCENSAYVIANHIISFQGHPEFEAGYAKYLMEKRELNIGKEKVKKAKETIDKENDGGVIAEWMLQFVRSVG